MADNFNTLMLNPMDSVAIALERIPEGNMVTVTCESVTYSVQVKSEIEFGHKFAVKNVDRGQNILKYGEVIGKASASIEAGEHVHVHNLEGTRGRGDIIDAV
jgi:altronate dehydratase small subunit